jgi:hypothetical protein
MRAGSPIDGNRWLIAGLSVVLLAACGSSSESSGLVSAGGSGSADAGTAQDSAAETGAGDTAIADTAVADSAQADTAKTDAKSDAKADAKSDGGEIQAPKVVCGDKFCGEGETCADCDYDCGPCEVNCGDGQCVPGETCASCPGDCGKCSNTCGNGSCEPVESCAICAADCGSCELNCGDGACGNGETCDSCPDDCGKCFEGNCDPYTSVQCKPGDQCFPYFSGELVCLTPGAGSLGQGCGALISCQKGLLCISSACRSICDAAGKGGPGCPQGKQCVEVGQPGKASAGVGACM